MAITKVSVEEFLVLSKKNPVLDVRSPGEFSQAHLPGAYSLPLFTDEERKVVGTAYKQESRQKAIKLGLDFYSSKMVKLVEEVEAICKLPGTGPAHQNMNNGASNGREIPSSHSPIVLVHCWRGGMRSAGVAWLLDLYGFKVYTLDGGYKAYRNWVLEQFKKEYPINILGGFTGSGKTEILDALRKNKQQVIDLENIASHKGSAFGNLGLPKQPSQEMFENLLAGELAKRISLLEENEFIWLEDESQRIGEVNIPVAFFNTMRTKQVYFLEIPFEKRLDFIVANYGKFEKDKLVNAIIRIKKRLGGLETKLAVNFLLEDNVKECFRVLLTYYDKFYLRSLQNRDNFSSLFNKLNCEEVNADKNSRLLKKFVGFSK
ncbi:MAG: tRNA 2-selenouridine(34) synthase MnmH [Bacteroidota bacterium]